MSEDLIIEWPDSRICTLRFNRPASHNALSRAVVEEARKAIASLQKSQARVLVIAGNGPSFCAGADLKERKLMSDEDKYAHNRQIFGLANDVAALPFCTIAAIGGGAYGGGCELALACDLRFAAAGATIGLTEARLGAVAGAGGTQRLPRIVGIARALEMMFSGEPISADKALAWGLVNEVAAADQLEQRVLAYATIVASRSGRSAAHLKRIVYGGIDADLAAGLEMERQAVSEILRSGDYKEGLAAFAERRAPRFE